MWDNVLILRCDYQPSALAEASAQLAIHKGKARYATAVKDNELWS